MSEVPFDLAFHIDAGIRKIMYPNQALLHEQSVEAIIHNLRAVIGFCEESIDKLSEYTEPWKLGNYEA